MDAALSDRNNTLLHLAGHESRLPSALHRPFSSTLPPLAFPPNNDSTGHAIVTVTAASPQSLVPTPRRLCPVPPPFAPESQTLPRVRILTPMALNIDAVISHHISNYNTPDSPPELDNSSSKSSSIRSSSLADATPSDISNFEDICLDDLHTVAIFPSDVFAKPMKMPPHSFDGSRQPEKRPAMGGPRSRRIGADSPLRVLTNAGKPVRPNSSVPNHGVHNGPRSPRRRAPTSPNPFLPPAPPQAPRARSISPSSSTARHINASSRSLQTPRSPRNSPGAAGWAFPGGRRSSWQPGRKTVTQLEEEYHDSDEELPEDAVIWNVPISPRPPSEREMSNSPPKHQSTPVPLSPRRHPASLPHRSSAPPNGLGITARQPAAGFPSLPRSVSANSGMEASMPRPPIKSRDLAMSSLSEEAKVLTQALEQFAEEKEKKHEEDVQSGSPRKRFSTDKRSITMSAIELPPVRKGELMIDPLPCSKEKEKVLTRTRPSWLPPKDPREEKKHLRQYQEMMAMSLEAEKKRAKKVQEEQCRRDDTQTSMARIWEQHVLPNWDAVVKEPRTRELWWRGVTPRDRGTVWQRAVGNPLGITPQTYAAALSRAHAARAQPSPRERSWFATIAADAATAFPDLKIFQPAAPLHQPLVDLLAAHACYRPDVGYTAGTHGVAALLLLNLEPAAAFAVLATLLDRPIPSALVARDPPAATATAAAVAKIHALVLDALAYKYPALHIHLTSPNLAIPPATYLDPLLRALFCTAALGPDIASRVMDIYVFEGDKMLVRAAVGTLARLESRLYGSRDEVLDTLGKERWEVGDEEEFMKAVREAGKVDEEERGGGGGRR